MWVLVAIAALLASGLGPVQARSGVIAGQILSRDGQPVGGVRISAMLMPEAAAAPSGVTMSVSFVLTDTNGRYRLDSVPPGRYYVIAGLVTSPTYYPGVASMNAATAVNVSAGATVTGVDFPVLPAGVAVRGRVIRPVNQSAAGTERALLSGTGTVEYANVNAADGSFSFSRIRPGTYNLTIPPATLSMPVVFVVGDKDVTGIEAVIVASVEVTGNILVENEGIRPRFSLSFASFKGGIAPPFVPLLPGGTFRVRVPEGEYRLGWSGLPPGYQLKSITSGSIDLLAESLKLATGIPVAPIVVTLGVASPVPWVKVSGRVTGLNRAQISGPARLMLVGGSNLEPLDEPINPDGSFEFAKVLPATYTARVSPQLPIPSPPIVVRAGSDVSDIAIEVPPLREVTGQVEGFRQAASPLNFNLSDPSGRPSAVGTATATVMPQPDGTFKILLPEAERRVSLNALGYTVLSLTYGSTDLLRNTLKLSDTGAPQLHVSLAAAQSPPGIVGGPAVGTLNGVLGGVIAPQVNNNAVPTPANPPSPQPSVARISAAEAETNLVSRVSPEYPATASAARPEEAVVLSAVISKDGQVENLRASSGNPLFYDAAMRAVRQWRYKPYMVNGQPTAVETTITINFGTAQQAGSSIDDVLIMSDSMGYDFSRYLSQLLTRLRSNWLSLMPEAAKQGEKGRVVVNFTVMRDGTVRDVRLALSSGALPLDRAATTVIETSSPFAALPSEFRGERLSLALSYRYNLKPGEMR